MRENTESSESTRDVSREKQGGWPMLASFELEKIESLCRKFSLLISQKGFKLHVSEDSYKSDTETYNFSIVQNAAFMCLTFQVGKLADLVMWKPSFFGVKPEMVIKGGMVAWADVGDPNASIPTPEPVKMRPMFGTLGKAGGALSIAFAALDRRVNVQYGLNKRMEAVGNVRKLTKLDMKFNDSLPHITVDPEKYDVTADGEGLTSSATPSVPLSRNYFLF
ncbi:unnamed protein product [Sphenostylis stenocarpa]|uniref:Urease domain-containing protein n=1 Tax=Sphenostylis stenocarpa TaxID=92480 RepID=A0AA86VX09_9FABA|nr:unnamed protein product [Sphenostylis stenocarpa]